MWIISIDPLVIFSFTLFFKSVSIFEDRTFDLDFRQSRAHEPPVVATYCCDNIGRYYLITRNARVGPERLGSCLVRRTDSSLRRLLGANSARLFLPIRRRKDRKGLPLTRFPSPRSPTRGHECEAAALDAVLLVAPAWPFVLALVPNPLRYPTIARVSVVLPGLAPMVPSEKWSQSLVKLTLQFLNTKYTEEMIFPRNIPIKSNVSLSFGWIFLNNAAKNFSRYATKFPKCDL